MGIIWFAPEAISFNKGQVLWLLPHLYHIREGYWPEEHRESGYRYIGGNIHKSGHHAGFEVPATIAAELEHRMERCGVDGLILEYIGSLDFQDIETTAMKLSHYLRTSPSDIMWRYKAALAYCCGWWRKKASYNRYCIHRRSYEKKKAGASIKPTP